MSPETIAQVREFLPVFWVLLAGYVLFLGVRWLRRVNSNHPEWHSASADVYNVLGRERDRVSPMYTGQEPITNFYRLRVLRAAGWLKRQRLRRALAEYDRQNQTSPNARGWPEYRDPAARTAAIDHLQRLLEN